LKYAILIEKDADSDYCVRSPDIDCCFSVGETIEEAVSGYRQALERYLQDLREMGQTPPKPTTLVDTIAVTDVA